MTNGRGADACLEININSDDGMNHCGEGYRHPCGSAEERRALQRKLTSRSLKVMQSRPRGPTVAMLKVRLHVTHEV